MTPEPSCASSRKNRRYGLIFGILFGFLLQKGGVGKYHILMGQLLLQDWTVVKVMLSAIVVGMVGVFAMNGFGWVSLHIKPTRIGANIIGGLIFGAGFALAAYCPGTGLTALGQGNWDALLVMAGLIAGSYLFAEFSARLKAGVQRWGELGEVTLADLLHIPRASFVGAFAVLLACVLWIVDRFAPR